ncbi:MAG TPA: HlyD family efflux transporter periplasmic adaptor subunit [bacterium]|nr:HlyD family efflux transporter periplasmic adaptor subunit [bacterium]
MSSHDAAHAGTQAPPAESGGARVRARPRLLPLIALVVLAAAGVLVWRTFFAPPPVPDSIVTLSGRIEGDDSAIAPKAAGKILEIRVREGDTVNAGDVIAALDDSQIRAQEDQARAALRNAEAQAQSARDQIAVLQQQLAQNQLQTLQAATDAQGRVRQAEAEVAAADENLAQQKAAYQMAAFNKDAYTRLAQQGAVSEQQRIQAVTAADQQAAAVAAAQRQVDSARGALTTAQANLANPGIRSAASAAVEKQIVQQGAVVASATAQVAQARAQLAEAEANRQDLVIRAPFSGTVITRAAEPGEVVTAGTAIVTLLNLDQVYLRGFVPEGEIGKVKIGQPAHVYLDSNPGHAVDAYVLRIDPQATFTPENTYFREDRVKQVVGVKLQLRGAFGYAKPGMPADGEILVSGGDWPKGWKGWYSQ